MNVSCDGSQSFCYQYTPTTLGSPPAAYCMTLPTSCASTPTCNCICASGAVSCSATASVGCACTDSTGVVSFSCHGP